MKWQHKSLACSLPCWSSSLCWYQALEKVSVSTLAVKISIQPIPKQQTPKETVPTSAGASFGSTNLQSLQERKSWTWSWVWGYIDGKKKRVWVDDINHLFVQSFSYPNPNRTCSIAWKIASNHPHFFLNSRQKNTQLIRPWWSWVGIGTADLQPHRSKKSRRNLKTSMMLHAPSCLL